MTQIWHSLLFAHWPLAPDVLRPLVPSLLPLDTFDGQCWISTASFYMTHVRPRAVPSIPWVSQFPEMNVRTYVIRDGIPGVYFFSLDADQPLAVAAARNLAHLPYFNARMSCERIGESVHYRSHRRHWGTPPADFVATYRPIAPGTHAQPGTLDYWLVERYCLYTVTRQDLIYRIDIHHRPWSLQPAEVNIECNTMTRASGIQVPDTTPLLHYDQRQEVLVWPLKRVL